jgi:hypothetical protein
MMTTDDERWTTIVGRRSSVVVVGIIVGTFLALCLVYNVTLPAFEASDEASHFTYADYLARERRFPDLRQELPAHEAAQPPLYYVLTALVISPFDRTNLPAISQLNPDWFDNDLNADFASVKNLHVHTEAERFPYQGAVWAVRAARLFSSLLGAATIVLAYLIARIVVNQLPTANYQSLIPPLAAALIAFNPKFIHVSSIVSNDVAITFAATLACWWMARMMSRQWAVGSGTTPHSPLLTAHFLALGALIGIAVLCKVGSLGLFAPAACVAWVLARPRRALFRSLIALAAGFALTAGWWFAFNTISYGDPLAWDRVRFANEALLRETPLTVPQVFAAIPEIILSYFGNIGIELAFPNWVNALFGLGLALAVIGCIRIVARTPALRSRAFFRTALMPLVVWQLALLALFVPWLVSYAGTENGRLIMPGIALLAILVAAGWLALTPLVARRAVAIGAPAALAALALVTPFWVVQPAFATPPAMDEAQLRRANNLPDATTGTAGPTFGGVVKLLHAELGERRVKPGGHVPVTLYWGATQPINQSYRVVLEALDAQDEVIGRRQFIPFNGRFSTQRWQPGQFFRDDYALPIDGDAGRGAAKIQLSLFAQYPQPGLLPIDGANADTFLIGRVKVDAPSDVPAALTESSSATFGQMIRLDEMNALPGEVAFTWTALKQPDRDYTLFVHVLDAAGNMIAQADAQPFDGQYPTGLWDANERVRDARQITLPEGAARLRIGWYDAPTGQRLPALKADGAPWPDDTVLLEIP